MEVFTKFYESLKGRVSKSNGGNFMRACNNTISTISSHMKPLTRENVLYYYIPAQGLASYSILSISIMNPSLMIRLFPKRDITNILVLSAGGGAGLWLWSRPHMSTAVPARRFTWAFVGGTLWTFGSILFWAIIRSSVGQKAYIGTLLGLSTGIALTNSAIDYMNYLELMFCGEIPSSVIVETDVQSDIDDEKFSYNM